MRIFLVYNFLGQILGFVVINNRIELWDHVLQDTLCSFLSLFLGFKGVSKGNSDAIRIIRRRAPPCLNVFCRLGCVCASLVHLRRHHHCGKPQCMLGCSCLRRKVVALKTPKQEESTADEPEPQGVSEENKAKWKKKNKKRKTYGQFIQWIFIAIAVPLL